jgi:hypothetical protein
MLALQAFESRLISARNFGVSLKYHYKEHSLCYRLRFLGISRGALLRHQNGIAFREAQIATPTVTSSDATNGQLNSPVSLRCV